MKAVITGDIVRSSSLNAKKREELYKSFKTISDLIEIQYSSSVVSGPLSNFRGDGWQLVLERPDKALEVALFIRTFFRFTFGAEKIDTRIAIGMGAIHFTPRENVSAGDGPAYTLSGRLLESLDKANMGLEIEPMHKENQSIYQGLRSTVSLVDLLVTKWSASQCQAVFWALQYSKQAEIAKRWLPVAITQASVSYNLNSAGWEQMERVLQNFSEIINNLIQLEGDK